MLLAGYIVLKVIRASSAKFTACHGRDYSGQFGCTKATHMGNCHQVAVSSDPKVGAKAKHRIHLPFEKGIIQENKPRNEFYFPKISTESSDLERYISRGNEAERKLALWVKKALDLARTSKHPSKKTKCTDTARNEVGTLYG